jgi:hypothetical protein
MRWVEDVSDAYHSEQRLGLRLVFLLRVSNSRTFSARLETTWPQRALLPFLRKLARRAGIQRSGLRLNPSRFEPFTTQAQRT